MSMRRVLVSACVCALGTVATGCAQPDIESSEEMATVDSDEQALLTCGGTISASAQTCRADSAWSSYMTSSCGSGRAASNISYTRTGCASGQSKGLSFKCCSGTADPAPVTPSVTDSNTTGATGCVSGTLSGGFANCSSLASLKSYAQRSCNSYSAKVPGNLRFTAGSCAAGSGTGVAFNCCASAGNAVPSTSAGTPSTPTKPARNTTGATGCVSGKLSANFNTCTSQSTLDAYANRSCATYSAKVPGNVTYGDATCSGTSATTVSFNCCATRGGTTP